MSSPTMCQDVMRALSIDAQRLSPEASAHLDTCEECRRYRSTIERLDACLLQTFRQPTREGIAQRVVLAERLRASRWRIGFGIAASTLIAVVALSMLFRTDPSADAPQDWGTLMAEHMEHDPLHEQDIDAKAVARLQSAMAEVGVTIGGAMPRVLRARLCPLGKEIAVHVVFEMNGERVVAFLMHKTVGSQDVQFKQWRGEVLTVNGGSVGVFARNPVVVQAVLASLVEGLRWQAV